MASWSHGRLTLVPSCPDKLIIDTDLPGKLGQEFLRSRTDGYEFDPRRARIQVVHGYSRLGIKIEVFIIQPILMQLI